MAFNALGIKDRRNVFRKRWRLRARNGWREEHGQDDEWG